MWLCVRRSGDRSTGCPGATWCVSEPGHDLLIKVCIVVVALLAMLNLARTMRERRLSRKACCDLESLTSAATRGVWSEVAFVPVLLGRNVKPLLGKLATVQWQLRTKICRPDAIRTTLTALLSHRTDQQRKPCDRSPTMCFRVDAACTTGPQGDGHCHHDVFALLRMIPFSIAREPSFITVSCAMSWSWRGSSCNPFAGPRGPTHGCRLHACDQRGLILATLQN